MAGKGDTPRPLSVTRKQFDDEYDRIFRKRAEDKKRKEALDQLAEIAQEHGEYDTKPEKE